MTDLENREAFEREYSNRFPHDKSTLLKSGNYSGWVRQASWEIWQASAQREGFKLVPLEPTKEMLVAARSKETNLTDACKAYKAMINAV